MRNLTKEAIELAEKQLIVFYPQVTDKAYRQQLPEHIKAQLFMELEMYGEIFESQLISQLQQRI